MLFTPVAVEYRVPSSKRTGLVSTPSVPIDHQPIGVLNEVGAAPTVSSEKSSTTAVGDICAETAAGIAHHGRASTAPAVGEMNSRRMNLRPPPIDRWCRNRLN